MDYKERMTKAIQAISLNGRNKKIIADKIGVENYNILSKYDLVVSIAGEIKWSDKAYCYKTGEMSDRRSIGSEIIIEKIEVNEDLAIKIIEETFKLIESDIE